MYREYCSPMANDERNALDEIVSLMEKWSGCPFSHFKKTTLLRRINRRLILTRCHTLQEYLGLLKREPTEYQRLFDSLTIKVSKFFRDPKVFHTIKDAVLPELFRQRGSVRVWCAACATGEEAYSMGILILEFKRERPWAKGVEATVIGSDVDPVAIKMAQQGIYSPESVASALVEYPSYFNRLQSSEEELYAVAPSLKEMVFFLQFDCTTQEFTSPPSGVFAEFDMVFLRNVLIYYDDQMKAHMLHKAYQALRPKGFLVLGKAEGLSGPMREKFTLFSREHKIYVKET